MDTPRSEDEKCGAKLTPAETDFSFTMCMNGDNNEVNMKKMIFLMALFLGLANGAYAWTFKTGTYDLSGGNSNWGSSYQGEVIIVPQGNNYKVIWLVGTRQTQVGVGVLHDDIFSVAFTDLSNPTFWGVASYRVGPYGELEGIWTSAEGQTQKPEFLVWKSYSTYY